MISIVDYQMGNLRSVQKVANIRFHGQHDVPDVHASGLTQLAMTTSWETPDDDFAEVYVFS